MSSPMDGFIDHLADDLYDMVECGATLTKEDYDAWRSVASGVTHSALGIIHDLLAALGTALVNGEELSPKAYAVLTRSNYAPEIIAAAKCAAHVEQRRWEDQS